MLRCQLDYCVQCMKEDYFGPRILHSFKAIEDFFSIGRHSVQLQTELPLGYKYNVNFGLNGYAKLLYDLVWAMAIVLNANWCQSDTCIPQAYSEASTKEIQNLIKETVAGISKFFISET